MQLLCQHPEGCLNWTEGSTDYCATHNALERKRLRDEARTQEKEKKARRAAEKMRERAVEKAKAKAPKRQASIPVRSKKRAAEESEYSRRKKKFLTLHPTCMVKGCQTPSFDVHHKSGRDGKMLINVMYFLAVCRNCHNEIELNPEWAKEQGYSVSRISINP
jgi:ATPase subunit of ABC transporter with duplicated ATPase domains